LIEKGASINSFSKTFPSGFPLHYASEKGFLKIVKYLYLQGSDINSKDLWIYT